MFTYVDLFLSTDSQSPRHSIERKGGRQRLQLTAMLLTQVVQYGSVADRKYFSRGGFSAAFKVEQYPLYNNHLSIIRRTLSVHIIIITLRAFLMQTFLWRSGFILAAVTFIVIFDDSFYVYVIFCFQVSILVISHKQFSHLLFVKKDQINKELKRYPHHWL